MEYSPKPIMRNMQDSWHLREMCRDLRTNFFEQFKKQDLEENYRIIEIGSYTGESSEIFAQEFPFMTIDCIDPWQSGYDERDVASHSDFSSIFYEFQQRTNYLDNLYWYKTDLKGYLDQDDKKNLQIAFVYIDGNHQYEAVKNDISIVLERVKPIYISGHDYHIDDEFLKIHKHIIGVKKAVDELIGIPDKVYKDGSWYKKCNK